MADRIGRSPAGGSRPRQQRQREEAFVLKINSLSIENFRSHKKTEINLDRINFFAGGNNAGKTSILAAIEWVLTGHCLWTDRARPRRSGPGAPG